MRLERQDPKGLRMEPKAELNRRVQGPLKQKKLNIILLWTASSVESMRLERQDPKGLRMEPKAKLNRRVQGSLKQKKLNIYGLLAQLVEHSTLK